MKGTAALLAVLGLAACKDGCRSTPSSPTPAPAAVPKAVTLEPLQVRRVLEPITINGEPYEKTWETAARTNQFPEAGGTRPGLPYSEARLAWDSENLYLMLYAADQDVQATPKGHDIPLHAEDAFHLVLTVFSSPPRAYELDMSATGVLTDGALRNDGTLDLSWESGLRMAVDLDGSLNDASGEDDEEWVVEGALPFKALGVVPAPGLKLGVAFRRCDTPKGATRRCSSWGDPGGMLELQ